MAMSRKEPRGGGSFAFPVFGIVALLVAYWLLNDWHQVPDMISSAVGGLQWPP